MKEMLTFCLTIYFSHVIILQRNRDILDNINYLDNNELLYNIVVSLRDDERNHVLFNVLNSKKIMIRK